MLKEKIEVSLFFSVLLDVVAIVASFFISFYVRAAIFTDAELRAAWQIRSYLWFMWTVIPLWIFLLLFERAYFSLERKRAGEVIVPTVKGVFEGLLVILAVLFFAKIFAKSRLFFIIFGGINVALLLLFRWLISFVQGHIFRNPPFYHNVLVVGTGKHAVDLDTFFEIHEQWGVKIKGFLNAGDRKASVEKDRIIGSFADLSKLLRSLPIDWVIFALPAKQNELILEGIKVCKELGVVASCPLSDYFPSAGTNLSLDVYGGIPILSFRTTSVRKWELLIKGILDRLCSFIAIVVLAPFLAFIALLIKLTSKGPVFFKQTRCGINGRKFVFYKFRTMIADAEQRKKGLEHKNPKKIVFKIADDPRVTKVGRFLRKTSIDELPQLFNVLRGDMSFVGPRPPVPEEVVKYEDWQRRRLSMKPGLTCLWQVTGRAEVDFDEWMKLDLEYIDAWSLALDVKILLRTIPAVISARGAY
jgi:exopolysaccharide biosynthesis polyprenyl glycosylphosphotransferase